MSLCTSIMVASVKGKRPLSVIDGARCLPTTSSISAWTLSGIKKNSYRKASSDHSHMMYEVSQLQPGFNFSFVCLLFCHTNSHVISDSATPSCSALLADFIHLACPSSILTCSSSANQPLGVYVPVHSPQFFTRLSSVFP